MCLSAETWATHDSTMTYIAATTNIHFSLNHPRDSHGRGIAAFFTDTLIEILHRFYDLNNVLIIGDINTDAHSTYFQQTTLI